MITSRQLLAWLLFLALVGASIFALLTVYASIIMGVK